MRREPVPLYGLRTSQTDEGSPKKVHFCPEKRLDIVCQTMCEDAAPPGMIVA